MLNFNYGHDQGRGRDLVEEKIIITFMVVVLMIQISKESHETMIIKEKLHKIRIQKVIKKYATIHQNT